MAARPFELNLLSPSASSSRLPCTGSGKTLAYLLPLIQEMREAEAAGRSITRAKAPRYVIIAPTSELCRQILRVARALAPRAPFRSIVLTGAEYP